MTMGSGKWETSSDLPFGDLLQSGQIEMPALGHCRLQRQRRRVASRVLIPAGEPDPAVGLAEE
jgi:hypothetical protein